MIPAGFMPKKIKDRPDWLDAPAVQDILSVSDCVSAAAVETVIIYDFNAFFMFTTAAEAAAAAAAEQGEASSWRLFYYEVYEQELDDKGWGPLNLEPSLSTAVEVPEEKTLLGFDVATFCTDGAGKCSPLSCNSVAEEIPTNKHCLVPTLEEALALAENPVLDDAEPGPLRVFAVYEVAST